MPARLEALIERMRGRNLRATFAHFDADAIRELAGVRCDAGSASGIDMATRRYLESGVCWRDPHAASPQIQARARQQ